MKRVLNERVLKCVKKESVKGERAGFYDEHVYKLADVVCQCWKLDVIDVNLAHACLCKCVEPFTFHNIIYEAASRAPSRL